MVARYRPPNLGASLELQVFLRPKISYLGKESMTILQVHLWENVIPDGNSKWQEVEPMHTTTTEKTLDVLRALFARYRLTRQLVPYNVPQLSFR